MPWFLLAGIVFRFVSLGREPLASFEAANSWPAWLAAMYTAAPAGTAPPDSALLFGAQSLLFFLGAGGEVAARLLPALLGVGMVILPWFWRRQLGHVPALVVAALLAVDPWLVAISRRADGASVTIFLGLLVLTALWQWLAADGDSANVRWQRIGAVGAGFLVVSGVQAWSFIPVLLMAAAIFWPANNEGRPSTFRWSTGLWFLGAVALGATGFAFQPAAVGAISTSLTHWLAQFTSAGSAGNGATWSVLRLIVDAPFILTFGIVGLLLAWLLPTVTPAGRRMAWFLSAWVIWGLLLAALPGSSPFLLPLLGVPLAIAAGVAVGWLANLTHGDLNWFEVTVVLAVETVLLVAGAVSLVRLVETQVFDEQLLLTAAIIFGLLIVVWFLFGFWAGWRASVKIGGLFFAVLLFLVTVRSSWQLSQGDTQVVSQGFFGATTLPGVRLLADDVRTLSILRRGDPTEAEVQVVAVERPDPVLGWYLREMRNLRWVPAPETTTADALLDPSRQPLVITPGDVLEDRDLSGYMGSRYHVMTRWNPSMLPAPPDEQTTSEQGFPEEELARLRAQANWSQVTRPRLQWLFFRQADTPQDVTSVNLWVAP